MKINEKFWSAASCLFWIFYVTFLVSSIPHLATWFRHLDGVQPLGLADGLYWLLAYGKSVAIDGADVLLTLAFLRKVSESEKSGWDYGKMVLICVFIIGFTGFSWYINWQYETQFMTADFLKADAMNGLFGNVGTSNPAVGSALQLFALVFTFISDTIMKQPGEIKPQKSLEMLRNEAAEAAERAALEKQIAEARTSAKIGLLQKARVVVLGSEQHDKHSDNDSGEMALHADLVQVQTEVTTEPLAPTYTKVAASEPEAMPVAESTITTPQREEPITDPQIDTANVTTFPGSASAKKPRTTVKLSDIPVAIDINTRRKPLTTSEAMAVLGVTEKTVREWKKSGKLLASSDGKGITIASVRKVVEDRKEKVS